MRRDGFVMLTVLWVLAVAAMIVMTTVVAGRTSVDATRNRVQLERARWAAVGCARRAQAAIDSVLRDANTDDDDVRAWRILDRGVLASPLVRDCDLTIEAAGTRLNLNAATDEMIVDLLRAVGYGDEAQEMVSALSDSRPPRAGPLPDLRALTLVPGFDDLGRLEPFVSVEPGRVSLATAPIPVLMSVPGFTRELAERIVVLRDMGTPISDLASTVDDLSDMAAAALAASYPDALRMTTPDPDAWLIRARARRGLPPMEVVLQWRIIRQSRRTVVVQTRDVS